jgi:aminoglycoside 3-N-acetyltransferase
MNDNLGAILKKIGLKKDDCIFIHSDLSKFTTGKNKNIIDTCEYLFREILKIIGENSCIIVPTFTYSNFNNNLIFDNRNTFSETGIFSEYIRIQKNSVRTNHPIFSVSAYGKKSHLFTKYLNNRSTGKGSAFERLFKFNTKILHINLEVIEACTFIHYIEEMNNVPYRYSKYFDYKIYDENKKLKKEVFENYARMTEIITFPKRSKKIQKDIIRKKICNIHYSDNFFVSLTSAKKLYGYLSKKMKKNIFCIYEKNLDI